MAINYVWIGEHIRIKRVLFDRSILSIIIFKYGLTNWEFPKTKYHIFRLFIIFSKMSIFLNVIKSFYVVRHNTFLNIEFSYRFASRYLKNAAYIEAKNNIFIKSISLAPSNILCRLRNKTSRLLIFLYVSFYSTVCFCHVFLLV